MYMQEEKNNQTSRVRKQSFIGKVRITIAAITLTGSIVMVVGGASGGEILDFGRGLAMLSVGIMQPEGGVQALNERLERIPAPGGNNNYDLGDSGGLSYTPGGGMQTSGELGSSSLISSGVVPAEAGDGGKIVEQKFDPGTGFVQGVAIKNISSRTIDIAKEIKIPPAIKITDSSDPQVLIMHTHTTESYMTYYAGYYNANDSARTKDETRSVVAVGESVSEQLRAAGIGVIHDVTLHDSPKYTGAYERSEQTVKKILKQYPSISVVIDLHRDAIGQPPQKVKPTISINGRKAAQMMIIASVCDSKTAPHPSWVQNLRFALRLQSSLHTQYSGIMRPLYMVDSRYNQHLTHGSLLIEVGSEANTVSEAVYSGEILGKTLAQVLNSLKK